MKRLIFTLLLMSVFSAGLIFAQDAVKKPLTLSVFTVATQLPGGSVVPIHPGLEAGTEFRLNKSQKNSWFQSAKLGVYYHRLSQTGILLYSENGFRPRIYDRLFGDMRLGVGYLHAISDLQNFKLDNGAYQKKRSLGRPQFMASVSLGLMWKFNKSVNSPGIFVQGQMFFQMPFIKSYVPVLPNTAFHVGVSYPIFTF